MTFVEVLEICYLKADEDFSDRETTTDKLMRFAINQAYRLIRAKVDKRTKSTTVPYSSKVQLPTDFFEPVEVSLDANMLGELDYDIIGDKMIPRVHTVGTNVTIFYVYMPTALNLDTDIIDLRDLYVDALTSYASYVYLLSQNKLQNATVYLNEFNSIVGNPQSGVKA